MSQKAKRQTSSADTAKVSTATASSHAAANASALSVPAAGGTSEYGLQSPNTLSLSSAANAAAPRCGACRDIVTAGDLWPVDISEDARVEVCSIRCLLAALLPDEERPAFLTNWNKLREGKADKEQMRAEKQLTPAQQKDLRDLIIAGAILEMEKEKKP